MAFVVKTMVEMASLVPENGHGKRNAPMQLKQRFVVGLILFIVSGWCCDLTRGEEASRRQPREASPRQRQQSRRRPILSWNDRAARSAVRPTGAAEAVVEKLAEGFKWPEGPVWVGGPRQACRAAASSLDIPENAWKWAEGEGISLFAKTERPYVANDGRLAWRF